MWTVLFVVIAGLVAACNYLARRGQAVAAAEAQDDDRVQQKIAESIQTRTNGWQRLPVFESHFELEPGEVSHFEAPASLVGLRTTQSTTVYHGASVRIPMARGVNYRSGAITRSTQREENWVVVDEGAVCITNRRIFFHGIKGNSVVRLSKIIRTYGGETEAVRLDRENGKPFVIRSQYAMMVTAIVQRLLADQRDGIVSDHFSIDEAAREFGILPA
jgi:hypothetical protein